MASAPHMGEDSLRNETFGEPLPAQCPPAIAADTALDAVYRLVPEQLPDSDCFKSHQAKGTAKPATFNGTDCEWASCSLNTSVENLLKISGLRRRNKFVATLAIPKGSGRHLVGGTHVHFWRFSGFDIATAVKTVVKHNRS